jgi:hypothetical protein
LSGLTITESCCDAGLSDERRLRASGSLRKCRLRTPRMGHLCGRARSSLLGYGSCGVSQVCSVGASQAAPTNRPVAFQGSSRTFLQCVSIPRYQGIRPGTVSNRYLVGRVACSEPSHSRTAQSLLAYVTPVVKASRGRCLLNSQPYPPSDPPLPPQSSGQVALLQPGGSALLVGWGAGDTASDQAAGQVGEQPPCHHQRPCTYARPDLDRYERRCIDATALIRGGGEGPRAA